MIGFYHRVSHGPDSTRLTLDGEAASPTEPSLQSGETDDLRFIFHIWGCLQNEAICFRRAMAYLANVQARDRLTNHRRSSRPRHPMDPVIIAAREFPQAKLPTVYLPACPTLAWGSILPVTLNSSNRCVICNTRSNRTKTASGNIRRKELCFVSTDTSSISASTVNPQPCLSSKHTC